MNRGIVYLLAWGMVCVWSLAATAEMTVDLHDETGDPHILSVNSAAQEVPLSLAVTVATDTEYARTLDFRLQSLSGANVFSLNNRKHLTWNTTTCDNWNGNENTACVNLRKSFMASHSTMYLVLRVATTSGTPAATADVSVDNISLCGGSGPDPALDCTSEPVANGNFNGGSSAGWTNWTGTAGAITVTRNYNSSNIPSGGTTPALQISFSTTASFRAGAYYTLTSLEVGKIYTIRMLARDVNSTANRVSLDVAVGATAPTTNVDYAGDNDNLLEWGSLAETFVCNSTTYRSWGDDVTAGPFVDPMTCAAGNATCVPGAGSSSRRIASSWVLGSTPVPPVPACARQLGVPPGTSRFVTLYPRIAAGTPDGTYRLTLNILSMSYHTGSQVVETVAAPLTDYAVIIGTPQAPVLTKAVSRKNHTGFGKADVNVMAGQRECRSASLSPPPGPDTGDLTILAEFDQPLQLVSGTPVLSDVGTVGTVTVNGFVATIPISDVPHMGKLNLSFPGIANAVNGALVSSSQLCVPVAIGDYNDNGRTDFMDFFDVESAGLIGVGVDQTNFRADWDLNGVIDYSDFFGLKSLGLLDSPTISCP